MGFRTNAVLIAPAFEGTGQELLRHFDVDARPVGSERLVDAWHPAHLSVGRLGGSTVVLDHLLVDLLLNREPRLEALLEGPFADRRVLALHVDEDQCSWAFVCWDRGVRRRALRGSARDGVTLDEGVVLPIEKRWPILVDHAGLRWVDERGRTWGQARMGLKWVQWLGEGMVGAPLETHPELETATVERFVEQAADTPVEPARLEGEREPLPVWLRRLLGR